ncbi:MAG: GNAT family N-acetyltransferase [Saprospiraceae bacterium]|nr:GNAT family N-acetyltransferase [Saprospiraceae bacterium]
MPDFLTLETERLWLCPTSLDDATFIYELVNSEKWIRFIGDRNVNSINAAEDYIRFKMISQLERLGYSNYTIIRKDDNRKIGTCGLYDREGLEGVDIGFALLSDYEGFGYAFEAAYKMKCAAFENFGLKEICAITTKDNFSSQKLLEKLGMALKGTVTLPNGDEELLLYHLIKS